MWHAVVWVLATAAAGTWSLACWALYQLLAGPDWAAGSGAWLAWLDQWRIPVWLADQLPMATITALKTGLTAWGPWLEALAHRVPQWLDWLLPLVWVGWALGMLAVVVLGAAGSVLVVALRSPRTSPESTGD